MPGTLAAPQWREVRAHLRERLIERMRQAGEAAPRIVPKEEPLA